MVHEDEQIAEFHLESILETTVSDDEDERVAMLMQMADGGPIRLLLSAKHAAKMLAELAHAMSAVNEQDRLNRDAANDFRAKGQKPVK